MLKALSCSNAQRLREFLAEAHYTQDEFQKTKGVHEFPKLSAGNLPHLLDHFPETSALNLLLRWFYLGVPVEPGLAASFVPEPVLALMEECGMLVHQGSLLSPTVALVPCDHYVFAADTSARMQKQPADVVIWPNPTSRLLYQFTIRRSVQTTLDLGAGCGIQAVMAASHSTQVTATDLNPRAAGFVKFNAGLNGVENIEHFTGDTFDTIGNRAFDLIVANPPFFVTPSGDQIYCENSMELDGYCRRVVREGTSHLNEGGYLQMVLEWVQVRGQAWQDRIREWLDGVGCDAWVFRGYVREAFAYAKERIQQASPAATDPEMLSRWMDYYRARGVEEIHGGLMVLRRRAGRNWVRIEDMPLDPGDPFGEAVWKAFAGIDFLEQHGDDREMLAARPRLSPDTILQQEMRQMDGRWQPVNAKLRFTAGIPGSMRLEPAVADFLAGLDGRQSVGELAARLAQRVPADPNLVQRECIAVVRKLMERRFLLP